MSNYAGIPVGLASEWQGGLQRLEQLARLGVLSASAAHEIKNALIPVRTFVELLLEQNPSSELAEVVRRELTRINDLVAQMLRLAQPHRTVAMVSLHRVLDDSLRLVSGQAKERGITIERRYEAQNDLATADPNQLEQVFLNLLVNGIEATEPGGKIVVGTESSGKTETGQIIVAVSDTGHGISEADQKQLFARFFSTKADGTGLGLAIAKDIVTEHGGKISVQSRDGSGTTFTVKLPLASRVAS